ncbi:MAG: hypothetical protein ACT4OZ_03175 [Gemmatimonadota bacterium]
MDARLLRERVARLLESHRLDVVLIGNAAAALHGSPVTTVDLDFMFRKSSVNLRKLRDLADDLGASILRPYYPASDFYRVVRDSDGLQLDFMVRVDGIRSFEALRSRAIPTTFGNHTMLVASLPDIIRSKVAAGRPQDRAVIPRLKKLSVKQAPGKRPRQRTKSALRRESDRALVEQIRRLLRLPMAKRTHFLRKRRPFGGSSI